MLTDRERNQAIKEARSIAASESYFEARVGLGYPQPHSLFDAGFSRGWDAACADRDKRIAELERQLEEVHKDAEELSFLKGDLLVWTERAVSKGNANTDIEEAYDRYDAWLMARHDAAMKDTP